MKFTEITDKPSDIVKTIIAETPNNPDEIRAPHGYWAEPAKVVKGLVLAGYGVSKAVDLTLTKLKMPLNTRLKSGLRSAYYNLAQKQRKKSSQ